MKLSEITADQLSLIATKEPEWMCRLFPGVAAGIIPDAMCKYRPVWMCTNLPEFMEENNRYLMVLWNKKWLEKNKPWFQQEHELPIEITELLESEQ